MSDRHIIEGNEESGYLATKLFVPQPGSRLVTRASLIEKLNEYHKYRMTLVSAPAGFGKTTIVAQWVAQLDSQIAWLSLDEKDNDPFIFLQYLLIAMQSVDSTLGVTASHALQTAQKQSLTATIIPLLNDISKRKEPLCIIFDDYHCITSHEVHQILSYMLEHQPPQLHIVVSTRVDPPFALARMRVRNNLSELRIGELSFSRQDILAFFAEVMGLALSEEEIAILEHRTEGWAAGLQLAAISLKGCDDTQGFIQAFAGDNRYIVDYLVEEVLQRQNQKHHDFLLKTSFLPQMSAGLCDYLLEIEDSQAILENVERQNLFIIPLDNIRNWYRYHHLFADLLYQKLLQGDKNSVWELRRRASIWHEENGYFDSAIDYAISAEDYERAVSLLGQVSENDWEHGKRTKLFNWFEKLPIEYIQKYPELCLLHAWVLLDDNKHEEAERSLDAIEQVLELQKSQALGKGNHGGLDLVEISGKVMVLRALIGAGQGDTERIMHLAEEALSNLPEDSFTWRANAFFALGIAYSIKGDLDSSVNAYTQSMKLSESVGNLDIYFRASYWLLARLTYAAQLDKAMQTCEDLFDVIRGNKLEQSLIGAGVYVSWGNILYECNRLDEAYENIKKDYEIIEASHDIGHKAWCYFCMMKVLTAQGDFDGAEKIIEKLEKLKLSSDLPFSFSLLTEAGKAKVWLQQGKIEQVEKWLQENSYSKADQIVVSRDADEIVAYRDLGHIILARYMFAKGEIDDCIYLLEKLTSLQEKLGRQLVLIEVLLLQAQVLQKKGDLTAALDAVKRALQLGEKGKCVRVFLNEGKPIARMIKRLVEEKSDIPRGFALKLLAGLTVCEITDSVRMQEPELLSERELEILRLVAAGLSNKKIVEKLFISLSTVKTHLRNIYSKLDTHSRTEAIAKANELNLL